VDSCGHRSEETWAGIGLAGAETDSRQNKVTPGRRNGNRKRDRKENWGAGGLGEPPPKG
jgi:hypothetical protein